MKPQVSELRKLLRMAGSRRRKLVKDIETMKDFLKTLPKALEYTRDEKTRYLEKRNKQLEQWVEVIDWLYQQIAHTDEAVSSSENISIGFTNAMTDEEKREILGKLTPEMTRAFAQAYADFIFRCEQVGIRVSGVSFYPEDKGKPQYD